MGRNLKKEVWSAAEVSLLLLGVELGVKEVQQQVYIHFHLGKHLLYTHTLILQLKQFLKEKLNTHEAGHLIIAKDMRQTPFQTCTNLTITTKTVTSQNTKA